MADCEFSVRSHPLSQWRLTDMAAFLSLSMLVPYLIHFIPTWDDSPIGARLLPIFYAPLIAAITRRAHVSVVVALLAPWMNHWLMGLPTISIAILLTIELGGFALIVLWLGRRFRGQAWVGPLGYLLAKPISFLLLWLIPDILPQVPAATYLATSVVKAWPGLIVLALLSAIIPRLFPPHASS